MLLGICLLKNWFAEQQKRLVQWFWVWIENKNPVGNVLSIAVKDISLHRVLWVQEKCSTKLTEPCPVW